MYLYIEIRNAKPAWLILSKEERGAYMADMGSVLGDLLSQGIEIVGCGINDPETPHRNDSQYFAVWKMENKEQAQQFEHVIEQAGFYNYFEQTNLRGEMMPAEALISQQIGL